MCRTVCALFMSVGLCVHCACLSDCVCSANVCRTVCALCVSVGLYVYCTCLLDRVCTAHVCRTVCVHCACLSDLVHGTCLSDRVCTAHVCRTVCALHMSVGLRVMTSPYLFGLTIHGTNAEASCCEVSVGFVSGRSLLCLTQDSGQCEVTASVRSLLAPTRSFPVIVPLDADDTVK